MSSKKQNAEKTDLSRRQVVIDVLAQTLLEILKRQAEESEDEED